MRITAPKPDLAAEPDNITTEENPPVQESIRPITIRLPSETLRKFKDLATVKHMSQAQLIEELLKEHYAMESVHSQTNDTPTPGEPKPIVFKPILMSSIGESINKKGKQIKLTGEILYTEQNRMFKEATIFSDNLKEDYDIDVSSGDYMFFNTVCIAKITASEDLEVAKHKFITWESLLLASRKRMNEAILRNDWVSFSDSATEVLSSLSDYVYIVQRSGIGFAIPDCENDESNDFFVPKSAKTKKHR